MNWSDKEQKRVYMADYMAKKRAGTLIRKSTKVVSRCKCIDPILISKTNKCNKYLKPID